MTASGFAWALAQTVGVKIVGVTSQIVLARILLREDFGQVALAYTIVAMASVVQQVGVREALIRHHAHFQRWATASFWMFLCVGCASSALMVMAAPIAGRIYGDPTVTRLILIIAMVPPIYGASLVAASKLQGDFAFRALAAVGWFEAVATAGLCILFAWAGFKAFSFVAPLPIVHAARLGILWWLARPQVRWQLHLRRWRPLYGYGGLLILVYVCLGIVQQGDYIVLKFVTKSTETVGIYYFAFVNSMHTMAILTVSLVNVLLPALSRLRHNRTRQVQAFLRALRVLAVAGVPLGLLQAALAGPIVRVVFGEKWVPAISVLQVLSLGMIARIVSAPVHSLLKAQVRYAAYAIWAAVYAVIFVAAAAIGAWAGGALGTAACVSIAVWICELAALYVAIRPGGGGWIDLGKVLLAPLGCSFLAVGAALAVLHYLVNPDPSRLGDVTAIAVVSAVSTGIYLPLIRWLAPEAWWELSSRAQTILKRIPGF